MQRLKAINNIPSWTVALFSCSCVIMNLLANKSIETHTEWLRLDCGILVSWIMFFCMDIITKHYGAKTATDVSIFALCVNLMMSLILLAASSINGTWSNGADKELNMTISNSWFVVLGSSVAFVVSSITNNYLNEAIGKKCKKDNFKTFAVRSYISTAVGQFIDNFVFAMIVSVNFFGWTFLQCFTCSLTGAIAELISEVIFSPLGYKVTESWKNDVHRNNQLLT